MNYGQMSRTPDLIGNFGRAFRIPMAPIGERTKPDFDATVAGWLLFAPTAHPFWTYWKVSVIHLRDIAGVKPALIRTPGATHEVVIAALDPGMPLPDLDAVGRGAATFNFLTPIGVMEQFSVRDDAQALQLCDMVVKSCVDGIASPDQDWRRWWTAAIAQTAQHIRDGHHPEARA